MKRRLLTFFLLLTICFVDGCYRGIRFPRCCQTEVTVTQDGKPMSEMKVTFYPTESVGNFAILAETDSGGVGVVKTVAAGKKKNGAPKGEYRVTVEKIVGKVADDADVKELESRMANLSQSEYLAEVQRLNSEKAQRNTELIELVPESLRDVKTTPLTYTVSSKGSLAIELSDY